MGTVRFLVPFALVLFGVVVSISSSSIRDTKENKMKPAPLDTYKMDTRIVGGKEAFIEDHPYQVSFTVNKTFFCGGFIISEDYILTAAHCAQNVDPSTVVLRAGSSWRKNGTIIPIAEVIPHPEYDNPPFDKDIGVMKTVEPINFTDAIQPVKIPPRGQELTADLLNVSGWGKMRTAAQTIPEQLMEVTIPVIDYIKCYLSYSTVLTENMFCGGNYYFGGKGSCQGDSGGAAVQNDVAVGIVSFGRGCGQPLSPSVFAYIPAPEIRDFITNTTGM